ncbi:MAG: helix-turn-helix domain-containing protein [Deltaproteobacteria bacterium]|nr:helix-turn-helix domain-containing protein [Deltaproteobacteria bacterium]MCL5792956.1 helix-turn-helix domain-containing protein [Deltaproteobacteria bacterium]
MSYTKISNDILLNLKELRLTPYDLTVYMILRLHDYDKGYSYPSVRTIAKITGLSLGAIVNCTKKLQNSGIISIKREKNHNVYTFLDIRKESMDASKQEYNKLDVDVIPKQYPKMENRLLTCRDNQTGEEYEGSESNGIVTLTQSEPVSSPDKRNFLSLSVVNLLIHFSEI